MKKGVSMLALVLIIVILGIITSAVMVGYTSSMNNLNKVKFITEFMSIESAVENYYSMNDSYPVEDEIVFNIDNNAIEQFEGENITDGTISLYKIDVISLGFEDLSLGNGNGDMDYYAISTVTGKVYYLNGFEINDNTYYVVTDELKANYE